MLPSAAIRLLVVMSGPEASPTLMVNRRSKAARWKIDLSLAHDLNVVVPSIEVNKTPITAPRASKDDRWCR